jgi:hypothetical protein
VLSRQQVSLANHTTVAEQDATPTKPLDNQFLSFQSTFNATSSPLPKLPDTVDLANFFDETSHFSFGDALPSEIVPMTLELLDEWTKACQDVGASPPNAAIPDDDDDKNQQPQQLILSVRAAGISILGLTLEWSALIGAKVMRQTQGDDSASLPGIEFVLIKDQSEASGNRALLWIYNKITKARSKSSTRQRETRFVTRFGFQESEENDTSAKEQSSCLRFQCEGTMEMLFPVPSAARGMMGYTNASKLQKLESKVNELITSEIKKDMRKAILHWENNFEAWAEKQM